LERDRILDEFTALIASPFNDDFEFGRAARDARARPA